MHLLYLFQHGIDAAYIAELHLTTALPPPSPPPFPSPAVPGPRRQHPALTLGVAHGPNSSSSATSPPDPNLRRFFSVAAAVSSLRRRLEEVSVEAAAAAAAVALGAGVEGAAEDRLRCCRDGSLPTTFSILSAQKERGNAVGKRRREGRWLLTFS
jgi:hypothetical protein